MATINKLSHGHQIISKSSNIHPYVIVRSKYVLVHGIGPHTALTRPRDILTTPVYIHTCIMIIVHHSQ